MPVNYYTLLGVQDFAAPADCKRAWKKLALTYHPDRHTGSGEEVQLKATTQFHLIASAYNVLKDPLQKAKYDRNLRSRKLLGTSTCGRADCLITGVAHLSASDKRWYGRYKRGSFGNGAPAPSAMATTEQPETSAPASTVPTAEPIDGDDSGRVATDLKDSAMSDRLTRVPGSVAAATGRKVNVVRSVTCPWCEKQTSVMGRRNAKGDNHTCMACHAILHEIFCSKCREWGQSPGERGTAAMACSCGNIFSQSRCPRCDRWNTWSNDTWKQGSCDRICRDCRCTYHEAFCPACNVFGAYDGAKGESSLECNCGQEFIESQCHECGEWGSCEANKPCATRCGRCGAIGGTMAPRGPIDLSQEPELDDICAATDNQACSTQSARETDTSFDTEINDEQRNKPIETSSCGGRNTTDRHRTSSSNASFSKSKVKSWNPDQIDDSVLAAMMAAQRLAPHEGEEKGADALPPQSSRIKRTRSLTGMRATTAVQQVKEGAAKLQDRLVSGETVSADNTQTPASQVVESSVTAPLPIPPEAKREGDDGRPQCFSRQRKLSAVDSSNAKTGTNLEDPLQWGGGRGKKKGGKRGTTLFFMAYCGQCGVYKMWKSGLDEGKAKACPDCNEPFLSLSYYPA